MNEVFNAVSISGLTFGVLSIVVGLIGVVLVLVGYHWVSESIDSRRGYTKYKGSGGCTVYQMHNKDRN